MELYALKTEHLENPIGIDAVQPRFSWKIRNAGQGAAQSTYRIRVREQDTGDLLWDSGTVADSESRFIRYGGVELLSRMRCVWTVEVTVLDSKGEQETARSGEACFEMGLLSPTDWHGVLIEPEKEVNSDGRMPAPYLRRRFTVKPGLIRARLYATAHGLYESYINGFQTSADKMKPGLTSYYQRIQYQTHDVTALLREGENVLAVILADGWWRGVTGGTVKNNFGRKLHFLGQLELYYDDGTCELIGSDTSFKGAVGGLLASDMQMGDIYDARREPEGWMLPDFDDAGWNAVSETEEHADAARSGTCSVPVREMEHFPAREMRDSTGALILDFSQNLTGYVRMILRNTKAGQVVKLAHGETLDGAGKFTRMNIEKTSIPLDAFQEITYICKGGETEIYQPMFSVFGFRYVKLTGYEENIQPGDFTAIALYSAMEETGRFSCSNPLINQLVHNCLWSQKGNFLDVAVDCPTRERNAWTGDAQIYAATAARFMDVYTFYEKWLYDQKLEQYASGKVGITFPSTSSVHDPEALASARELNPVFCLAGPSGNGSIGEDAAGWGDSAAWIPYILYRSYGDKSILERQFETARRYVDFELACAKEENPLYADRPEYHTVTDGERDADFIFDTRFHYGEWNEAVGMVQQNRVIAVEEPKPILPPQDEKALKKALNERVSLFVSMTAKKGNPLVATAYMARSAANVARMAEALGKTEEAEKYSRIAERIRTVYEKHLIGEDGVIEPGHQAPYVRALAMGLVTGEKKEKVFLELLREIHANGDHLNTGFLSTPFLLPVLCEHGESELAYKILEVEDCPGWLYPVKRGLTTIPESWDGVDTLNDSLNHYSYGAVADFLFGYTAGIRPMDTAPGYREYELQPIPGGTLTYAEAVLESPLGEIRSSWKKNANGFEYCCSVPVGACAHLTLPNGEKHRLPSGEYKFVI